MAKVKAEKVKAKKFTFDDLELILLSLPTVIWYLIFSFLPLFGLLISFKNWRVSGGFFETFFTSEWVGFKNFKFLFTTGAAMTSLRNTLLYNLLFVVLGVVIPVTLAIMISNLYLSLIHIWVPSKSNKTVFKINPPLFTEKRVHTGRTRFCHNCMII